MPRSLLIIAALALAASASPGWLLEERLTERPDQPDFTCLNNARAAAFDPAGNLHVVWYGGKEGRWQAWYSSRDAESGQWSPNEFISDESSGAQFPAIAADESGRVHVTWSTADSTMVRYRSRSPAGEWGSVETPRTGGTRAMTPSIAIGRADSVFVAWSEATGPDNRDVFISARSEQGWDEAEPLSDQTRRRLCFRPSVVADTLGQLAVVWQDHSYDNYIFSRAREDTGWGRVDTLTTRYSCSGPSAFLDARGVMHVSWHQFVVSGVWREAVYRQRRGGIWGDTVRLPRHGRDPRAVSVLSDGNGNVHLVYSADTVRADTQLYHVQADSLGQDWTQPIRLTDAAHMRESPTLSLSPHDHLAVVWTDYRHNQSIPDVFVRRTGVPRDLAVIALDVPDTVDVAETVLPRAVVANQGDTTETFSTWLLLPDGYRHSVEVTALAPGGLDTLAFPEWTATVLGNLLAVCSIPLVPDDTCPANNVLEKEFFVRFADAEAEWLVSEPSQPWVRDTVRLRAGVHNAGNVAVKGWCRFEVEKEPDSVFRDSLEFELEPGDRTEPELTFVPELAGSYQARATVLVDGDMRPGNDTASCRFEVFELDVRVSAILAPGAQVDSGTAVVPAVLVTNHSIMEVSCLARFRVGESYFDTAVIENLAPDSARAVEFDVWPAHARGELAVICSLFLLPDTSLLDVADSKTFVVVRDVRVDSILQPQGELSAEDPVVAVFRVRNAGTGTADFDVFCRIADEDTTRYFRSRSLTLAPDSVRSVEFEVGRLVPGSYLVSCSLGLAGDMRPENDTASAAFTLHAGELWLTAILAPGPEVDSGVPVVPGVAVRNVGGRPARFAAHFGVTDGYTDSVLVPDLPPGRDTVLSFAPWAPAARGRQELGCSLLILPDSTVVGPLTAGTFVFVRDAAVESIVAPRGAFPSGPTEPLVRFGNRGNVEGRAVGRLRIAGAGYDESVEFALRVGPDTTVRFPEWDARPGRYELVATVAYEGDMRPENDTLRLEVFADSLLTHRWQRLADLPPGNPPRPVRRGAWLVSVSRGILGLRASGTRELFRYDVEGDSWSGLASVPGERAPRDGSAACAGPGDSVFVLRGRGEREFLCYHADDDRWEPLDSLPFGLRPVRYGTGMACDAGSVFLATGSGRFGFLVYLVESGRWHARRPVPPGPQGRRCRHGTDLVRAGNRLFLLKGGSSEFYEYCPAGDTWPARANLPPGGPGNRRRTGRGAALAAAGDSEVYALRGRGNEFWRYDIAADSWVRLEDVPPGESGSRVGRGAALVGHQGRAYLLKGGGSDEFWCYDPEAMPRGRPERSGVLARPAGPVGHPRPMPTLVRGILFLRSVSCPDHTQSALCLCGSTSSPVLLDASGRKVMELMPGENDVRHLAPGVYFVREKGSRIQGSEGSSAKVIIQR